MNKSIEQITCIICIAPAVAFCKRCGLPLCSSCISQYNGYCDICADDTLDDDKYDAEIFTIRDNRFQRPIIELPKKASRNENRRVFGGKRDKQSMENISFR